MAIASRPSLPNRLWTRWHRQRMSVEDRPRLEERVAKGEQMAELMRQPAWAVLEELRQVLQHQQDAVLHFPSSTEAQRHDAMVEWNTLQQLFSCCKQLIREGQDAKARLAKP